MATSGCSIGLAMPAMSAACPCVAPWAASAASAPVARAAIAPAASTITARAAPRSDRSRPRLFIDVPLHLAPLERQRARLLALDRAEHLAVQARQQPPQPALVRHAEDDHAGALVGRKPAVVQVVAIEGHQGAPELPREPVVLDVARAPQIVVLDHR